MKEDIEEGQISSLNCPQFWKDKDRQTDNEIQEKFSLNWQKMLNEKRVFCSSHLLLESSANDVTWFYDVIFNKENSFQFFFLFFVEPTFQTAFSEFLFRSLFLILSTFMLSFILGYFNWQGSKINNYGIFCFPHQLSFHDWIFALSPIT